MGEIIFSQSQTELTILAVTQGAFILAATILNLISWVVFRIIQSPNSLFKQIILGLVCIQVLDICFQQTFTFFVLVFADWSLGNYVCSFSINVSLSSVTMSSWLLTLLIIDRYLNSRFYEQYKYYYTNYFKCVNCVIWFGLLLVIVPLNYVLSKNVSHFDIVNKTWHCHLPFDLTSTLVHLIFRFILPLTISVTLILRLKYFLRKNKINTCSEEGLTNGRSPDFSGTEVRVQRPKTPWGDAWWNDINHKIDSGPNNILPPLNTNLPPLRLETLPPVTMKRGKKHKGVVRLKGDMNASKRNSIFSKDVTTLLKERLSRQRNSLPDIRNGFNTQFSSPLVAWQKLLHSQKMEKESDDFDRSSSNSEETDDTKQTDVVEVLTTDSYACSESSPRDEDDELLSSVCSTDKDSGNSGQNMEDGDLPSFGEGETRCKEGKLIKSIVEKDGLTMTNDTKNSTQELKTTNGLDSNLSDVSNDAEKRAGDIPDQKPNRQITRKSKTRKKKTLHQSKTRKQENEKLSKDIQQIDLNSECLNRQDQNSVSSTTKQEEDIFGNVNLINVIIVVILINFIISLPKVFLEVYLAFCSDCSISFHVFHSLRLIDDVGRILSPFFIVVFHESFRLIMVYFVTCTKCKSRAVRND